MYDAARNVLIIQTIVALLVASVYYFTQGGELALAGGYGAGIALLNTLLQIWHIRRAERFAGNDAGRSMRVFVRYELEKFGSTIALFAIGIKSLELAPLALLLGFVLGQAAVLLQGFKK